MWNAVREPYDFARTESELLTIDLRGQRASGDHALFVFDEMDVARRTLTVRRQGAPQSEEPFFAAFLSPELECFTGMSVVQSQSRDDC